MNLEMIPRDILQEIFLCALDLRSPGTVRESLSLLSSVCKDWREICRAPPFLQLLERHEIQIRKLFIVEPSMKPFPQWRSYPFRIHQSEMDYISIMDGIDIYLIPCTGKRLDISHLCIALLSYDGILYIVSDSPLRLETHNLRNFITERQLIEKISHFALEETSIGRVAVVYSEMGTTLLSVPGGEELFHVERRSICRVLKEYLFIATDQKYSFLSLLDGKKKSFPLPDGYERILHGRLLSVSSHSIHVSRGEELFTYNTDGNVFVLSCYDFSKLHFFCDSLIEIDGIFYDSLNGMKLGTLDLKGSLNVYKKKGHFFISQNEENSD